jgi:hypothetical protein
MFRISLPHLPIVRVRCKNVPQQAPRLLLVALPGAALRVRAGLAVSGRNLERLRVDSSRASPKLFLSL